jgi:hypothetical protein
MHREDHPQVLWRTTDTPLRRRLGVVRMRRALLVIAVGLATLMAAAWPATGASHGSGVGSVPKPSADDRVDRVDFNGDGFDDLAIGAAGEGVGGQESAGAVNILYGSASGLVGTDQVLTQANPERLDLFGLAVAKGDFNADGFTDLAVGAPWEAVGASELAGAVNIFYGSANGLAGTSQVLLQANPEPRDLFGQALDAGLFNDDDVMDLAVGAPGEDVSTADDAGAVNVFYGSTGGLPSASQVLLQANPEDNDGFGGALVAGFFNDNQGDLAVGAPGEQLGAASLAGAVNVFYGTPAGLPGTSQVLLQANPEADDQFGSALAAGFFDDDLWYDLAVGAPGETVGGKREAGAVNVFSGSASRLTETSQTFLQGPGTGGIPEVGDLFGLALAAGPFDAGPWDLAVGAPGEDFGVTPNAGAINVLYGSASGLVGRDQLLTQDSPGVPGIAEADDHFGDDLARGIFFNNFNGDDFGDLAIGTAREDVGATADAGAVNVMYGSAAGLPGASGQLFTQDSSGVGGTAEPGDSFGASLD